MSFCLDLTKNRTTIGRNRADISISNLKILPANKLDEVSSQHFVIVNSDIDNDHCPVYLEVNNAFHCIFCFLHQQHFLLNFYYSLNIYNFRIYQQMEHMFKSHRDQPKTRQKKKLQCHVI